MDLTELFSRLYVTVLMKKTPLLTIFIMSITLLTQEIYAADSASNRMKTGESKTVRSPPHRVVMLELYTSEGCSSCPPADRFLSDLKVLGITDKQLIPMAFHVTYWDYIGWKDRFANKQFDDRQRDLANKNKQNTVYTPQFVFSGDDYRQYASFSEDVNKLVSQIATVDLVLTTHILPDSEYANKLHVNLESDFSKSETRDIGYYIAVIENNLFSVVSDGENSGEKLHHDYVVRHLEGPYFHAKSENQLAIERIIKLQSEWKRQDLSIVAFAENSHTGEVLQAVRLKY